MINKNRLTRLTQKVVRINSENPPGNELELSQFIEKDMRSMGLDVRTYTFAKNRPNVIVTLKGTAHRRIAAREAILISPHIDTVPAGGCWRFDPFGGTIHKGRIYGRGTTDDKGNLACCIEVMRSLIEDKVKLKKDVICAATVDEETGSRYGIIPLLQKNILKPKAALIIDSNEFDTIIAQKGLIHFRLKIFGKKAHGAYNWRGVNAIESAAKVITRLKKHKFKYKQHPLLRPPTINIGVIKGGDKVNVVSDFCEMYVDLRYLPGMKYRTIINDLKQIVRKEATKFKIDVTDHQFSYEIDRNHKIVKTYVNSARKMHKEALLKGSEGATVITFFQDKGIPAVATGFGSHNVAHTTDEYAKIDILYKGAKVLEQFLKDYDQLRY